MRTKWLLLSGAVGVVVVVVVVLATRDNGPPPVASGPGVFRVHAQIRADGGQSAPTRVRYRGMTFELQLTDVAGKGPAMTATLGVEGPDGSRNLVQEWRRGTTIHIDGAGLELRTIYAGDRDSDDLVDVQVIPPDS